MSPQVSRRKQGSTVQLLKTVAYVLGSILVFVAVAMLTAALVSLINGELDTALWITVSAALTVAAGLVMRQLVPRPSSISVREGFVTVGLAWFVFSLFGAIPYLLTGAIPSVTDAVFETASGFTTTGASILADPAQLPDGIAFWRGLTQWLGGMGVIVLGVAVLPLLGTGGAQLAQAESPGPTLDRLTPRFQETAKRLWIVYAAITVVQIALLAFGDMDVMQSVIHSFTTMSTGGFGTEADSVAGFSNYTQWVITFFMFVAGVSFALHYRALSRPVEYMRNSEFKLYLLITVAAIVVVAGGLWEDLAASEAVRHAAFNTVSIVTTTGFASTDFGLWRPTLQIVVIGLMFVGGMAGSTAGAIKTFRIGVLSKAAYADLRRLIHPRGIFVTRFGGAKVSDPVVEAVQSFFLFYMFLFMTSVFLLAFIDANIAEGLDLVTAASAVAASLGNIGPGLGDVGPAANYSGLPILAKWLLSSLMIVGRLELFPVLVLFTKDLWKR
ncbi:MAG TPA: TrkH family potassium uptake protein [Acidimicrobiia bacterium]|nr:TrkH family potassium uptake protein [Acidimicrobiia bacterium]